MSGACLVNRASHACDACCGVTSSVEAVVSVFSLVMSGTAWVHLWVRPGPGGAPGPGGGQHALAHAHVGP